MHIQMRSFANDMILFPYFQVISVTFVNGGDAYNVIPETVSFGGTFRSLTTEGLSYLKKRIKEVN
jgi:metal-dependent amidase/aminoacylase/carboxypeptidase family protein